ncbi:DoxX family membrane protein [Candidatus Woesearchaeota archaeon]|nr:DoxX family membrane protein [Candidatus Woesearchaeota archaeon]
MEFMKKCGNYMNTYGDFLLRVVVGLIMTISGFGKLFATPGIEGFSGMLSGLGFPIPSALAVIVGIIELLGGLILIIGYFDKYAARLLAIIILVAIITVHLKDGWNGFKYQLLLFAALLRYFGNSQTTLMNMIKNKFKPYKT